jgi:hypothetical protein
MDSATHHAIYTDVIDRRREAAAEYCNLDDRRSELRRHQRQYPVGSEAYNELDLKIKEIDGELATLDVTRSELGEERDRLMLVKAEGFDYVRPNSFINRFLPTLPKGTKEVDKGIATLSLPSSYWRTASLTAGIIVLVILLLCIIMPSVAGFGAVSLLSAPSIFAMDLVTRIVLASIFVSGAGVLFTVQVMPHTVLSCSAIGSTTQYVLGAEQWSRSQRLQSCIAYALYSPANLLYPVLFIPVRFILMYFVMRTYLNSAITEGQSPAIAAAATVLSKSIRLLLIALSIMYVIGGVLLVI